VLLFRASGAAVPDRSGGKRSRQPWDRSTARPGAKERPGRHRPAGSNRLQPRAEAGPEDRRERTQMSDSQDRRGQRRHRPAERNRQGAPARRPDGRGRGAPSTRRERTRRTRAEGTETQRRHRPPERNATGPFVRSDVRGRGGAEDRSERTQMPVSEDRRGQRRHRAAERTKSGPGARGASGPQGVSELERSTGTGPAEWWRRPRA
jgi:hypothetical protein